MRCFLFLTLPLAASITARAQTARTTQPLVLAPNAQGELALKNGDYLLLNLGIALYTGNNSFDESFAAVAYEHFWAPQWSWGGRVLAERYGGGSLVIPEVLLRHRSAVGPLTFGQRLSVERHFYAGNASSSQNQNWGRLRLDLEKVVPLGGAATGWALRPRLAFEAATHLRLQKNDDEPSERFVQYTSVRAEVGVRTGPRFDFTPWFAYGTEYIIRLPRYDDKNVVTLAGGKLNTRTPLLGLDLRYTFGPGLGAAGRQQLPTQH